MLARASQAPRDSFDEFSAWLPKALVEHVEAGHAMLSIYANDPDLLKDQPPDRRGDDPAGDGASVRPFRELISRNQTNWAVDRGASASGPRRCFPTPAPAGRWSELWEAIGRLCRLDRARSDGRVGSASGGARAATAHLEPRRYAALKYRGPGTELTIGLPAGHIWVSGRSASRAGIPFAPNLPTEEVFTMPHKDRVDGTVRSTKPLSYGGTLIEDFTVTFCRRPDRAGGGRARRGRAAAAGRHRRGRGAARRSRARAAQLADLAVGRAVLQHALRRERRQPRRARLGLQVHADAAATR